MRRVRLVGIGLGHPDHLTVEAVAALRSASVALVTVKRAGDPLAAARRELLAHHAPGLHVVDFAYHAHPRRVRATFKPDGAGQLAWLPKDGTPSLKSRLDMSGGLSSNTHEGRNK